MERGLLRGISLDRVRRVLEALGARVDVVVRWNGGDLDGLLSARHSGMHELVATQFSSLSDWEVAPEVSFSIYGERGVIDVLAWHAATASLLVIELKTEIVDVNELMSKADQRRRLAPTVGAERGWVARTVSVWVVVADSRTTRRRLAAHQPVLRTAFPADGRTIGAWLRKPAGTIAALSFLTNGHDRALGRSIARQQRVRRAHSCGGRPRNPDIRSSGGGNGRNDSHGPHVVGTV
jgi:hypothetical protein